MTLGNNAGRDVCLATGLGRSRLIEELPSQAGLGVEDRLI